MDWYLESASDGGDPQGRLRTGTADHGEAGPGPAARPSRTERHLPYPSGQPLDRPAARHCATDQLPRTDPDRLDLAVAAVIERQAEVVLAGVQVAALHSTGDPLGAGAVLPGGCPPWLAADLDLMVQTVRLAACAGVVLPNGMAAAPPGDLVDPREHLLSSRACYRDVIDVLGRLSVADEVTPICRDDALRLLRQVERRVHHLDDGHPAAADEPRARGPLARHEFIPGELLG